MPDIPGVLSKTHAVVQSLIMEVTLKIILPKEDNILISTQVPKTADILATLPYKWENLDTTLEVQ